MVPSFTTSEHWRKIPRLHAEASSLGNVRTVDRVTAGRRRVRGRVLLPELDRDGYPTVKIGGKRYRVAVLVQTAFAGPPEVRHLDGVRSNSKPENLVWGSRVENEQDKRKGKDGYERDGCYCPFPSATPPVTGVSRGC